MTATAVAPRAGGCAARGGGGGVPGRSLTLSAVAAAWRGIVMANIGYIQVVRHCNQRCGFCSNPINEQTLTLGEVAAMLADLDARGYFGVVLTGGEPTLSPLLPDIIRHAKQHTKLQVRLITNGARLADAAFCDQVVEAGVDLIHVSVYSVRPEVEAELRGVPDPLPRAFAALENLGRRRPPVAVNVNCVINARNADHLDENVRALTARFPFVSHYIWNMIDPSMGRAGADADGRHVPRFADFEVSLARAMRHLDRSGRTFRVERVPLCYMVEYAHCSTETRKIVKDEERIVHFLDDKGMVRETSWRHRYAPACDACRLRPVCAGVFDQTDKFDVNELHAVFTDPDAVRARVLGLPPGAPSRGPGEAAATAPATARARGSRPDTRPDETRDGASAGAGAQAVAALSHD